MGPINKEVPRLGLGSYQTARQLTDGMPSNVYKCEHRSSSRCSSLIEYYFGRPGAIQASFREAHVSYNNRKQAPLSIVSPSNCISHGATHICRTICRRSGLFTTLSLRLETVFPELNKRLANQFGILPLNATVGQISAQNY